MKGNNYWILIIVDMNDHKHCLSCFQPNKCKLEQNSCEIIKCVNSQCELRFHKCKLEEHLNETCKFSQISCINHLYGCRMKLLRGNLLKHLDDCPANIVECKAFRLRTVLNKDNKYKHLKWPDPIQQEKVNIGAVEKVAPAKQTLSDLLLEIDYESFKKYAAEHKLKFNCFYKYLLLNLNNDNEQDFFKHDDKLKAYLQRNSITSKIFHDIKIDNCIFFDDNVGCHACRLRLSQLVQERYNKLTANLKFSELLKSVYSYEQFIMQKIYDDRAFLYLYHYYHPLQEIANDSDGESQMENLTALNNELIKSNNEIVSLTELNPAFSLVRVPLDDMKDVADRYKHLDKYSSFRHRQTVYTNTCNHILKRQEYSTHYDLYHNFLNPMCDEIDKPCPYASYGCKKYTKKYKFFLNKNYTGLNGSVVNLKEQNCIAFKYYDNKQEGVGGDDYFERLPIEVIHYIVEKLDSLSLFNLSITSKFMRNICLQLIEKRGIVFLKWKKECFYHPETNEKIIYWTSTTHRTFSKHIEKPGRIEVCSPDAEYMNHIQNCPFKRINHLQERFKLYPI